MTKSINCLMTVVCAAQFTLGTITAAESPKSVSVELPKAQKIKHATWRSLWYVQFKPSKVDQGLAIMDRLERVWRNANLPEVTFLKMRTGKWQCLTIFTLPDGAQGMEWLQTPDDEKFWQALAKQEGGAEKAMALWAELTECIQDQQGELAFAPKEAQQAQESSTVKELAIHREIERNKEVLLRAHGEGWSKGNLDAVKEVYGENCVGHFNWGSQYKGVEAVKARVKGIRTTYPDWCETVNDIIAEGDFVATRWTSTGTHSGADNPDLAGKKVSIMEIGLFRVKDGKIVEQWSLWDYDDLQQQLAKERN